MSARRKSWPIWIASLLIILLIGCAAVWFARKPIASFFAKRWCSAQALQCSFELERLELSGLSLSNLRVDGQTVPRLVTAERAEIAWTGLLSPTVTDIKVQKPGLRAAFDGEVLTLDGLEQIFSGNSEASGPSPILDIRDGSVEIVTPAGSLQGGFSLNGQLPKMGRVEAALRPTELKEGEDWLVLKAGTLGVEIGPQSMLTGRADLQIETARLGSFEAENMQLSGVTDPENSQRIDWNIDADKLVYGDALGVTAFTSSGEIGFDRSSIESAGIAALKEMRAAITADKLTFPGLHLERTKFDLQAARIGDTAFDLAIGGLAETLVSSPISSTGAAFTWDGRADVETQVLEGAGYVDLSLANLDPIIRQALFGSLKVDNPLKAHFDTLRNGLDQGFAAFSTKLAYRFDYESAQDWQIVLPDRLSVKARNGLTVELSQPGGARDTIQISPNFTTASGLLRLSGAGLPAITADLRQFELRGGETLESETLVKFGGVRVPPWTRQGLTVQADLNRADFERSAQSTRLDALGEVSLSGALLGLGLQEARLFGGIRARSGSEGWRVETVDRDCLGLDIAAVRIGGTFTLSDLVFPICPEDGRFIRQQNGRATGRIILGDVNVPIAGKDLSGVAGLKQAELSWSTENGLTFGVIADALNFPMQIGSNDLTIAALTPEVTLATSKGTQLQAGLGRTELSGSLVPASIAIRPTSVSGTILPSGFSGATEQMRVEITDIRDDPLYRPLLGQFNMQFDGTGLQLTGPIQLGEAGPTIAETELALNLVRLDGTASLTSRDLLFSPRGLQPKDLSDRVRGLLSNGRGLLRGKADFTINAGKLAGSGSITAEDFGFDTLRIGAVDGVTGDVNFSDILSLTTAPGQEMQIGKINPGVPLSNGTLTFQVLNGREANIESAIWPFAGGMLTVDPTRWTIAGTSDVITVNANAIELSELVEALSLPDLQAEGTVTGSFPIELVGGNAFIRDARLIADAKGGVLKYTGSAVQQAATADETVGAAFTALRDFRFSVLELGVNGNLIDDIIVSLTLLGRNPDVLGGSEFKYNISIDSKLAQLIQSGRDIATSSVVTGTVVDELTKDTSEGP